MQVHDGQMSSGRKAGVRQPCGQSVDTHCCFRLRWCLSGVVWSSLLATTSACCVHSTRASNDPAFLAFQRQVLLLSVWDVPGCSA